MAIQQNTSSKKHVAGSYFQGALAIVIASLLWGTTGTAASFSPNVSSLAIGAFAMGVGGMLLLISNFTFIKQDVAAILKQPKLVFWGSVSVAVYPLAFYSSMRFSGVAIGTIISIASAPLFAVLLERLFGQKRISLKWLLSFAFGAMGIVLLALGKQTDTLSTQVSYQQQIGIALGCVAGLTYAGYSWAARRLIETHVHSRSAMTILFACAALVLLPSLWFTGGELFSNLTNSLVSLYMAIVPMFLGYKLFAYGLNYVDASSATLITLIEPLFATMLAIIIVGESFDAIGWIGCALVCLCLVIQSYQKPTH